MKTLKNIDSVDSFIKHISSHFLGKDFIDALNSEIPEWKKDWNSYLKKR